MRTIYVKGRGKKNAIWILLNVLTSLCMQGQPLTVCIDFLPPLQFHTGVLTIHYDHQTCDSLLFCLQEKIKPTVPIVHFQSAKPPFIICMKLVRRLGHSREWQFWSGNSCVSVLDREKEQKFQLLSKCLPSNLCQLQLVNIIHVGKVNWEFWNYLFLLLGQIYMLKCSLKGNIETFKLKKKVSCIDEHLQNKNVNQFLHFISILLAIFMKI